LPRFLARLAATDYPQLRPFSVCDHFRRQRFTVESQPATLFDASRERNRIGRKVRSRLKERITVAAVAAAFVHLVSFASMP
jgi:hypothetical protein